MVWDKCEEREGAEVRSCGGGLKWEMGTEAGVMGSEEGLKSPLSGSVLE